MTLLHRIQALQERLTELEAFRDRRFARLPVLFEAHGEAASITVGARWPTRALRVTMRLSIDVPSEWAGLPVRLRCRPGGEALVVVDDRARFGLNPHHDELLLTEEAAQQNFQVTLHVVPRGLVGTPVRDPHLEEAAIVVPDVAVRDLYATALATLRAAQLLAARGHDAAPELLDTLERALVAIDLPRGPSDAYLARLATLTIPDDVEAGAIHSRAAHQLSTLWEEPIFDAAPLELDDDARRRIDEAHGALRFGLDRMQKRYPSEGAVNLVGHSHIDIAWLWPIDETRRKVRRTFATAVELLDRFDDFRFAQSSAVLYAWIEDDDPELFARVKAHVASGRWAIVGGSWVEPDGNITSGESTVRQFLYGQRYFRSRFDRTASIGWLPDTFGYAANLPQLFLSAQMPYFTTTKLHWNETNPFPYDLYRWEGLDGSSVVAHTYKNLNPDIGEPQHAADAWRGFRQKAVADRTMMTFGWGDGGGGPTEAMVEAYERLRRFPALPRLEMSPPEVAFEGIDPDELPTWRGEKYLEFHRGTFTSQERLKQLVRRVDRRIVEAEAAATLASLTNDHPYPRAAIDAIWQRLLVNEFHDILPGSSIATVAREAEAELASDEAAASVLRDEALTALLEPGEEDKLVVFNLTLEDRPLVVETVALGDRAPALPHQRTRDGTLVAAPDIMVPGLGFTVVELAPAAPSPAEVEVRGLTLDNGLLRVRVEADGTIGSIFDLEADREVLRDRANRIFAYEDLPRAYEAWEIDERYEVGGRELLATEPVTVEEEGPLRASIRVERRARDGVVVQHYRLTAGARRLDIVTSIQWNGRRTMLRAQLPLAIRTTDAWYEVPFGAVSRPTHTNTSWDRAKFEVPAMRWADLSEHGYGVSLLNDGRHGHAARGDVLSLTLMRTPIYPDPAAGDGEHHFTYAVHPHADGWQSTTLGQADDVDAPLVALVRKTAAKSTRYFGLDTASLRLAALKMAEDSEDVVLRVYESHGARGTARLAVPASLADVRSTDLLETIEGEATAVGEALAVDFEPWRVLTLRFGRGPRVSKR